MAELTPVVEAMIFAGRTFVHAAGVGVRSILEGELHPLVVDAAQDYALYEAAHNRQLGHRDWNRRYAELRKLVPGYVFSEVTAESWSWQKKLLEAAESCFDSWRQSPGHWSAVNGPADIYGYALARGEDKWFGCGIVGRKQ